MRQQFGIVPFVGLWMLMSTVVVVSFPTNRNKIPNGCFVPNPCNTSQVWCGVGHESKYGAGPRNPFGLDFFANGQVWNATLCNKDSDGDGLTNGQELGDPNCTWTEGSTPACSCSPVACDCGLPLAGLSHPGICEPLDHPRCVLKNSWFNCPVDFNCPAINGPNVTTLDLFAPNAVLQPRLTTYVCHFFVLPNDTKYHLIGTTPLIDNHNYNYIHHLTVYACKDLPAQPIPSGTYECSMNPPCFGLIGNYIISQPFDCLPPEFGIPIGVGNSYKYAILQIHYNNPTSASGITDSSGMRLFLTTALRPNDGGVTSIGQLQLNIPPGLPLVVQSGTCKPECGEPQQQIYLTRLFLHMHLLGRAANVTQFRNGQLLRRLLVNEPFSIFAPRMIDLNPYVDYQFGDELRIDCAYDSTSRQCNSFFGEQTTDEMCFVFPTYYPLQPNWDACLQHGANTVCDKYFVVPGCNTTALYTILPTLATCNFVSLNPCAVPCFADIITQISAAGCLTRDVLELLELNLRQQGEEQAVSVIGLIWTCGGVPPQTPPAGCLPNVTTAATVTTKSAPKTSTVRTTKLVPKISTVRTTKSAPKTTTVKATTLVPKTSTHTTKSVTKKNTVPPKSVRGKGKKRRQSGKTRRG